MGWNGRYQVWGACGYYYEQPTSGYDEEPAVCACGGKVLHVNTVDDTNGEEAGFIEPDLHPEEPHHDNRWRTVPDDTAVRTRGEYIDPYDPDKGWRRVAISD